MARDDHATTRRPAAGSVGIVVRLLQADVPAEVMGAPQGWPRWAVLLPHVLAATGHADSALAALDDDTGQTVSWLLDRPATYLQVRARLAEARPLAERALAIDEAAYGPDHPAVGTRLNNLALILQDLGEAGQARPLAERALAIDEAAYGPDHPAVRTDLGILASILDDLGLTEEADNLRKACGARQQGRKTVNDYK
jgi:tetratricopeptide (TPR) repeat protein